MLGQLFALLDMAFRSDRFEMYYLIVYLLSPFSCNSKRSVEPRIDLTSGPVRIIASFGVASVLGVSDHDKMRYEPASSCTHP